MAEVHAGRAQAFGPLSALRNLARGAAFPAVSRLDSSPNSSRPPSRDFYHGLLARISHKIAANRGNLLAQNTPNLRSQYGPVSITQLQRVCIQYLAALHPRPCEKSGLDVSAALAHFRMDTVAWFCWLVREEGCLGSGPKGPFRNGRGDSACVSPVISMHGIAPREGCGPFWPRP